VLVVDDLIAVHPRRQRTNSGDTRRRHPSPIRKKRSDANQITDGFSLKLANGRRISADTATLGVSNLEMPLR
jgi:hypothetical protein